MKAGEIRFGLGFQGQEGDDEVAGRGNSYTAEYWQYDSRLGRRWNFDPIVVTLDNSLFIFDGFFCCKI